MIEKKYCFCAIKRNRFGEEKVENFVFFSLKEAISAKWRFQANRGGYYNITSIFHYWKWTPDHQRKHARSRYEWEVIYSHEKWVENGGKEEDFLPF